MATGRSTGNTSRAGTHAGPQTQTTARTGALAALALLATGAASGGCAQAVEEDALNPATTKQALAELQTLYFEGFETGQPQLVVDSNCDTSAAAAASGSYGLSCDDTATLYVPVSTVGATDLTVSFVAATLGYESNEQLIVEASTNAATYETVQTIADDSPATSYSVSLGSQYEDGQVQLRFRSDANGWRERFYIDDITVEGLKTADPCDGVDNDGDGVTDEDFVSTPTDCGEGACSREGQTLCEDGVVVDSCVPGTPAPSDLICDQVDEDCDGEIDEDADCGGCTGPFVAFAEDHVAAGRAYVESGEDCSACSYGCWYPWGCGTTGDIYRAIGSDEVLSSSSASKLFQSEPGVYTEESCGATQYAQVPAMDRVGIEPGERFPAAPTGQWNWHDVDGATCRDGSPAGLQVRYGSSDNLVIYLEGGGACFNPATCAGNPASANTQAPSSLGILSASDSSNPVANWNVVFIPYCTGDVFFGNQPNGSVPGVAGTQRFVGQQNMRRMLERLIATFPNANQVLLTGESAGGFGSIATFHLTQQAFDGIGVVHPISDSGPPFGDDYLAPCLTEVFQDRWNIYATTPSFAEGDSLSEMMATFASWYPNNSGGIVSSTQDGIIREFWSFGEDGCTGTPGDYTGAKFTAGLLDMRNNYLGSSLGSYFISGTDTFYDPITDGIIEAREKHTWFRTGMFYDTRAGNHTMAEWVSDTLNGTVTDLGPD